MTSSIIFRRTGLFFNSQYTKCIFNKSSSLCCLSSQNITNVFPLSLPTLRPSPIFYGKRLCTEATKPGDTREKSGLIARFKQMYKDYWYVLVPVHLVTSACWFTAFYYLAKSGVDVVALLKSMGLADKFVDPLKDSSMGYFALAYGMYKVATPLRYTVTLGGTTISIKYLKNWGYIKPMPSKEKMKEMYLETKQELRQRKDQFQARKGHIMRDYERYKEEMKTVRKSNKNN